MSRFQLPAYVALPLSLDFVPLAFDKANGGVTMGWKVLDGNREYIYEIERSYGGVADFSVVGYLAPNSKERSAGNFQFVDSSQHPRAGRYYYRINVLSTDDQRTVYSSEIRMVQVPEKKGGQAWYLFPNPVNNGTSLYLQYRGGQILDDRKVSIRVYSPSSGAMWLLEGTIGQIDLSDSLTKMPKGLFFVEVQHAGRSEVFKAIR